MLNIPALRQIQKQIKAHPTSLDMRLYILANECGTVACIAGWALLNSGKTVTELEAMHPVEIRDMAVKILGLPGGAECIFYADKWPTEFKQRRIASKADIAQCVSDLLDHVIERNGIIESTQGDMDW